MDGASRPFSPLQGKSWADFMDEQDKLAANSEPYIFKPSSDPYEGMSWADAEIPEEEEEQKTPIISSSPPPISQKREPFTRQVPQQLFNEKTNTADWANKHFKRDEFKTCLVQADAFVICPQHKKRNYEVWISFLNGQYADGKKKWAFARARDILRGSDDSSYTVGYINPEGIEKKSDISFDKTLRLSRTLWDTFWSDGQYKPFWNKERPKIKYCPGEHVRGFLLNHFGFPKNDTSHRLATSTIQPQSGKSCLPSNATWGRTSSPEGNWR